MEASFLQEARDADERPRGPEPGDEVGEPSVGIGPDLRPRRLEMCPPVRGIGVLVRIEVLRRVLPGRETGRPYGAVGSLERIRQDELGAAGAQDRLALGRSIRRQKERDRKTERAAEHRVGDTRVAGGRFEDRLAGVRRPEAMPESSIARTGRSLTLPQGFMCSALASSVRPGTSAAMRASSRSGVPPTASSSRTPNSGRRSPEPRIAALPSEMPPKRKSPPVGPAG